MSTATTEETVSRLREQFGKKIFSDHGFRGETTLLVDREAVADICLFCRDELSFDYLVDVCSVDNSGDDPRFEMVYHLYSYTTHLHLRLKCSLPEDEAEVATVSGVWPTANWHEREVFDMMGITFKDHPDPRRILMWEGYPYHPLRKEFPLGGKESEMPDVAFSGVAPLDGGPFVTSPSAGDTVAREPRARDMDRG